MKLMQRIRKTILWRVLRKIKRLPEVMRERQIKQYEKNFNGMPLTPVIQKEIQKIIRKRDDIYFRDEKTARSLADNWNEDINKPQNLRFIENAVPVVLCANEDFAPYTAVMLQSLLDNSNPQRKYHFIILERDFSNRTKDCMTSQVLKFSHCAIDFINVENTFNKIPIFSPGAHFSVDMYTRLFIPYWLDKYPKIIYCDGDMLAKTDISRLYDLDIENSCIGAIQSPTTIDNITAKTYDFFRNTSPIHMLLKNWNWYLNSGLLVFDTKKFKERISYSDMVRSAIYFTNRYAKHNGDQDVLSLLIKGDYFILPSEWNYCLGLYGHYRCSDSNTKIIHFTTEVKPWKDLPEIANHPDALAYRSYAKNVPLFTEAKSVRLNYFEVHLSEHCNLNCSYCTHFCPVAEPSFPNIEQFERDFVKLGQLTNGYVRKIKLMGGEPLLNPDIVKIMYIARQNFSSAKIKITTNGILLTKMKGNFWTACKNNDIYIYISQYPIKLNMDKIFEIAANYGVSILFEPTICRDGRNYVFWLQRFDMSGKRNAQKMYEYCYTKRCTFLKDGKIYLCAQIPSSQHLEKRFGVKFSVSKDDFLVLDDVKDVQEILDFISHPSPFCGYCATDRISFVKWSISARKQEEWIL